MLKDENVLEVLFLAKKYEVDGLIKKAEKYMEENINKFALDIFMLNQNNSNFLKPMYEDIISSNLEKYLVDEKLLKFDLQSIYRIFSKYRQKYGKQSDGIENKIIDIKFSYLKKYGKDASVLFSDVDLSRKGEYMNRLLIEFADVFDFHYINDSMLKNIYETKNGHLKIIYENIQSQNDSIEQFKKDANNDFDKIKAEFSHNSKEYNQILKDFQLKVKELDQIKKENSQIHAKYINIINEFDKINKENLFLKQQCSQIKLENEQITKNEDLMKKEIECVTKQNTQLINEIGQLKNNFSDLKNEITQIKNQNPSITVEYSQIKKDLDQVRKDYQLLQSENHNIKTEFSQTKTESFQVKQEFLQIRKEFDPIQKNNVQLKLDFNQEIEKLKRKLHKMISN